MRSSTCVIGLGLIGGSLLRALSATGHQVSGYDASPDIRALARASGPGWRIAETVDEAMAGADVVILAVPFPAVVPALDEIATARYRGVLSDVTSVKGPVRRLVAERFPQARYVGGHPMAGKEVSSFAASDPGLFTGCAWALTLDPGTDQQRGQLADWLGMADLVTGLGARVVPVTSAEHDAAVALISHLPHLVASGVAAVAGTGLPATLAAGSYRDGTRVAASQPGLVAGMCGGNAAALGPALDLFITRLSEARRLLDNADPVRTLAGWLHDGHHARTGWPPRPGPVDELPVSEEELLRLGRDGGWVTAVAADRRTVSAVRPLR
ncbi:MAG TPA: prephenate dehydrogenase/arogenate dehydrogenase family protein [Micromonosporaceae bacterium]